MRTVDLELDYLETGRSTIATATPRPTRGPTRTPTPRPNDSGVMVYTWGLPFDCRSSVFSQSGTTVLNRAQHFGANVDFTAPTVANWSIGFIYHSSGPSNITETYIMRSQRYGLQARHITWKDNLITHIKVETIDPTYINTGRWNSNELFISVGRNWGTILALNDNLVILDLPSLLTPRISTVKLCIGMVGSIETASYSIPYSDLWSKATP